MGLMEWMTGMRRNGQKKYLRTRFGGFQYYNSFSFFFAQVLVLVHQVFLDLMTHSFFKLSDAALLIMDECHHAQVITRYLKGNSPNFCYLVSRLQNKGLFFQKENNISLLQ